MRTLNQRSRHGLAILIGEDGRTNSKKDEGEMGGGAYYVPYSNNEHAMRVADASDGFADAVNELVGFDMSSVSPYLSAFTSGFGGDKDKDKSKDDEARREKERLQREKEAAEARSRTILWVVLGTLFVALAGTATYFIARKK